MKEINLRDFYPWYKEDVIIEVTEEVAEELLAGQRYIKASRRRVYRNKAHYSLDAEDGIEYSACFSNPSPQELIERMERFEYLCHALNSLPAVSYTHLDVYKRQFLIPRANLARGAGTRFTNRLQHCCPCAYMVKYR